MGGRDYQTLRTRAEREGWPRLHPGVWALPGSIDIPWRRIAAAIAAIEPGAYAGRRSAAWLWGLWAKPASPVEVLVLRTKQTPGLDGVLAWRSRTAQPHDFTHRDGIPVTVPARTIADLAAVVSLVPLTSCAITAHQRGLLTPGDLADQYSVMGKARGAGKVREIVRIFDRCEVDSSLELEVRDGIRLAGLPPPLPHPMRVLTPDGRVVQLDIAWPDLKIALEVDGLRWHSSHEALTNDHVKSNQLQLISWTVLRVGWWRWQHDRARFLAELHQALRRG